MASISFHSISLLSHVQPPDTVRIVCISDTHGHHHKVEHLLPAGDMLIFCGDFGGRDGSLADVVEFNEWLGKLPYKDKIVIAGKCNTDRTS